MDSVEVAREEGRRFNRKLLVFFHVLAALSTAAVFLSMLDLSRFAYARRGAGAASLLMASPPLLPYLISAIHAWRRAPYTRLRVVVFLAILVAGTLGVTSAMAGAFGLSVDNTGWLWTFAIQAAVYFLAAEFLFTVD